MSVVSAVAKRIVPLFDRVLIQVRIKALSAYVDDFDTHNVCEFVHNPNFRGPQLRRKPRVVS